MRRLFIIRKDLNLSAGKLAAMVGHCAEAYWMNKIKTVPSVGMDHNDVYFTIVLSVDELNEYVKGIFTKTICEAKNLNQLMKAADIAKELDLLKVLILDSLMIAARQNLNLSSLMKMALAEHE